MNTCIAVLAALASFGGDDDGGDPAAGARLPESLALSLWDETGLAAIESELSQAQQPPPPPPGQQPPPPAQPGQEQPSAAHGPYAVGGRFMLDTTSRTISTPLADFTTDTVLVLLGINFSYYADPELKHEVGGEMSMNVVGTSDATTDSTNLTFSFAGFYHYNHPMNEKTNLIVGAGFGMTTTSLTSGAFTSSTVEVNFDARFGFKFFVDKNMSVDFINKLVFGVGTDDLANTTTTVGFNMLVGISFFFDK
jgi:hypothetical protein